ncbi:PspC domain-containing protein [Nocardioides sp.]|uniref:PspC domain-containing protein n=1 Tax=Nocardioides sp. TaxID=35761 RepID=UPI002620DDA0|nr:PspC domain-containing protein [Nocardioides sp.]MDI6912182.1 PspC domain-containing protein [Nocardioides sp.]
MNDIHQTFARNGLIRPRDRRVLGGVCAGLGRRLGLDPWPARLLFVLALMVLPGSQILVYPILWILMPAEENVAFLQQAAPAAPPAAPTPPTPAG